MRSNGNQPKYDRICRLIDSDLDKINRYFAQRISEMKEENRAESDSEA